MKFLKLNIKNPELSYHTELMLRVAYLLVQHGINCMDASSTDSKVDDDRLITVIICIVRSNWTQTMNCEEADPESDIEDEPTFETQTDGATTGDTDVDMSTEQTGMFKKGL